MSTRLRFALLCNALLLFALGACHVSPTAAPIPWPEISTITPTPTSSPTSTITPSPTPLGSSMVPYTIAGLRERHYEKGSIKLTEKLETTSDFTRYAISYPSDDLTITGILQIPPGDGPFPVIVMNHGFVNRDEYHPGDGTSLVAEVLNRNGYITIASDYRGWGGSDRKFSLFHTGLVVDVVNLINAIPSIPQADSQRIGIWGHSMGGGITTKVLTIVSNIRAAVLYAPNSADDADLIARWGYGCIGDIKPGQCLSADTLPSDLPPDLVKAYKAAGNDPELLRQIAPIYHLDTINTPIQIHIGAADGDYIGSTPPEWSRKLYDALVAAGKPAELFVYPWQRHSFTGEGRDLFLKRIVAFYDLHLK